MIYWNENNGKWQCNAEDDSALYKKRTEDNRCDNTNEEVIFGEQKIIGEQMGDKVHKLSSCSTALSPHNIKYLIRNYNNSI